MSSESANERKGAAMAAPDTDNRAAAGSAAAASVQRSHRSLLFVAGLLVAAIAAWGCMQFAFAAVGDDRVAVITDGAGTTQRIPLSEGGSYEIETDLGTNVVVIENGEVRMAEADCPGHDCIDQGAIDGAGEIIVCLPHKLIVSVEGAAEGASAIDGMAS